MIKCLPWPWLFKLWIVSIVIIFYRVLSRISSYEGKVSQSTIFRGMFRFLGGHYIFFSNVPGVMLSTNAMFKSVLNIESSYRTSVEVLCAKMTQDRDLKGTSLLKLRQSRNSAL